MNKKGFTLVELLASLAIMSIIATVLTLNITGIFKKKEQALNENRQNLIITAANVYLELNQNTNLNENCKLKGCTISVSTLIKEGLLNEEDVNNSQVINIYYENNEQKYKIE